ncbi:MAG TPA: hypothetical protein VKQ72_01990, partial [Aggregatilineales bacterium]|nr:hypothetical protein [Aggregatilineales bacterium]
PGLTQFSPDGQRLGTINYALTVGNQHYTQGTLKVLKLSDGSEQFSQDGVASFNLQNDGATFLQFFTNTKNEANAADISFWDGSKTRKIEQNVQLLNKDPKKDCEFVTAKILRVDQNVYTMFGEHCTPGGTTWRLHLSSFSGGQAGTDVQTGPTPQNASFFYSADTNNLFLMPGNKQALVVLPNGGQSNLGDLNTLTLADGTIKGVVGSVEVANYPPTAPVRFLYSPKGDKLAFVTLTSAAVEQLFIYDLNSPDKAPVAVPNAGGTNNAGVQDKVPGVAWSGDGSKLFFDVTGNAQALYSFDPSSSQSTMVVRGTYSSLAVNADGSAVATGESVSQGFGVKPLQNLVVISVSDGSKTNLIQGAKNDLPVVPVFVR